SLTQLSACSLQPFRIRPAHRPARLCKAGLQFLLPLVVVDVASGPVFVRHQRPSALVPLSSFLFPPSSLLSRPPPIARLSAAALVDGVEVLKKQPVTARLETVNFVPRFALIHA